MRTRKIEAVLRELAGRGITRVQAAKRLGGISVRQVNRLMQRHGVKRAPGRSRERAEEARALAEEHRRMKPDNADVAIAGKQSVEEASVNAGCSVRTMYRWMARIKKCAVSARKRAKTKKK